MGGKDRILDNVYKVMEPLTTSMQVNSSQYPIAARIAARNERVEMYMPKVECISLLTDEQNTKLGIAAVGVTLGDTTITFNSREEAAAVHQHEGVADIMKKYGASVSFGTSIRVPEAAAKKLMTEIYEKIHPSEVKKDVGVGKAPQVDVSQALSTSEVKKLGTISKMLSSFKMEVDQGPKETAGQEVSQKHSRLGIKSFVESLTGRNNAHGNSQGGGKSGGGVQGH